MYGFMTNQIICVFSKFVFSVGKKMCFLFISLMFFNVIVAFSQYKTICYVYINKKNCTYDIHMCIYVRLYSVCVQDDVMLYLEGF